MNSKTRVLNAFNRTKSDRIPIDYSTNPTIHGKVQKALKVKDYEGVLKAFNVDFRCIWPPFKGENKFKQIKGLSVDPVYGFYTKWIENEYGGYQDFCNFPLQNADSEAIYNFHVPSPDEFDYSEIEHCADYFKEYAVYAGGAGLSDIINATGRVMGMEDTLVNLLNGDEATLNYINRRCDMELGIFERIMQKAKGKIDFFWMGEDLGTQNSPMVSLELYRKVFKPIHQKFIDAAKAYKLPVMIHTCGSSSWAYNDFIKMGIDAVDTLQPEAKDMSPKYLVDNFGGRLSFHGCISTAGALAYGSAADIEKNVRETIEIMKPCKGYMLAPTHAIQDNSPVENVLRMYECAVKYGKY